MQLLKPPRSLRQRSERHHRPHESESGAKSRSMSYQSSLRHLVLGFGALHAALRETRQFAGFSHLFNVDEDLARTVADGLRLKPMPKAASAIMPVKKTTWEWGHLRSQTVHPTSGYGGSL